MVGHRLQIRHDVGAAHEPEVHAADDRERGDVQAHPHEQWAHRVEGFEPPAGEIERNRRAGDVRYDNGSRRGRSRREADARVHPSRQCDQARRCGLGEAHDLVCGERLLHLLGRHRRNMNAHEPFGRVVDVGRQTGEHVAHVVADVILVGLVAERHRARRNQRGVREFVTGDEVATHRSGDEREHDVVDLDPVRVLHRPDAFELDARCGELPAIRRVAVEDRAGRGQREADRLVTAQHRHR